MFRELLSTREKMEERNKKYTKKKVHILTDGKFSQKYMKKKQEKKQEDRQKLAK